MNLQEELDTQKRTFESSAPYKAVAIMHRATEELRSSGIMDRIDREGDKAPDFTLRDAQDNAVHLRECLAGGPVVLGFCRGRW